MNQYPVKSPKKLIEVFFAFALGKEEDNYLGFAFGSGSLATLDESSLLIDRQAAIAYRESTTQATPEPASGIGEGSPQGSTTQSRSTNGSNPAAPAGGESAANNQPNPASSKKQFYGTITLNPVTAKMDFATVMDEVVQQFTAKLGVEVNISIEIEAKTTAGFDEALQRTVKENCNVLKFANAEFEGES